MSFVGWLCSYVPEELILAGGFLPRRIVSDAHHFGVSHQYLPLSFCPYVKRVFSFLMEGRKVFDGVIFAFSCDGMRRLKDICSLYWKGGFVYGFDVPRRQDKIAEQFFLNQLKGLKEFLEGKSGRKITDDDLHEAIWKANRIREHVLEIYRKVTQKKYDTSFKELSIALKNGLLGQEDEVKRCLKDLTYNCNSFEKKRGPFPRIMIYGGILEDFQLYKVVEESGAKVAVEDTCTFLRCFESKVEVDGLSPMEALAKRYLYKLSCPRMADLKSRIKRILRNFYQNDLDGIIFHSLKFCDLTSIEYARLYRVLKEHNIPILHIEREEVPDSLEQIKTRIQAFIELIKDGVKYHKPPSFSEISL